MNTIKQRLHCRWTMTGLVLVCCSALVGCKGSSSSADRDGCRSTASAGADPAGTAAQDVNPIEETPSVVVQVDLVAQVTVVSDVIAASDEPCDDHSYPAYRVRARIDEVLYADLPTEDVPAVGTEIEITAVGTVNALSSESAVEGSLSEAIVALRHDVRDPLDSEARVPWLADGTGRVAEVSTIDTWRKVIAIQVESNRSLEEFRAQNGTEPEPAAE